MNQFNVQRVEFNVLEPVESRAKISRDSSKSSRLDISREGSNIKLDTKVSKAHIQRTNSNKEKFGISRKFTDEVKRGVNVVENTNEKPVMPSKKPPIEKFSSRINSSPIAQNKLPEKRNTNADTGAIQQREKIAKMPLIFSESEEDWDFSTSGIKRDLLRIAQDEEISEYRARVNTVPIVRPSSAVEARHERRTEEKGKAGSIVRGKKAPLPLNPSTPNRASNWVVQTFDDSHETRAKPLPKGNTKSHEAFQELMKTLSSSKPRTETHAKSRPSPLVVTASRSINSVPSQRSRRK